MGHLFSVFKLQLLSLLFTAIPFIVISQGLKVDSSQSILRTQENDTIKVKTLLQLAEANIFDSLNKSLVYCKQAYSLSDSLKYSYGMAESQYRIALYYMRFKNLPDSSLPYANRAIAIADSLHYLRVLLKSYRLKIIFSDFNDDMIKLKYFVDKCLEISIDLNDSIGIGKAYATFGIISFNDAKYDSSVIWYMKALKIYKKAEVVESMGVTYINLAKVFIKMGEYDLAEKYLLRAMSIEDELWKRTYLRIVYDNLGLIYIEKGSYKKAVEYFDLGINETLLVNNKTEYAFLLINKSLALRELGRFDEGIAILEIALQVSREIDTRRIEISALSTLANFYTNNGMYWKAIAYYDSTLIVLREANNPHSYLIVYQNLSPIYEKIGDYKNAFLYQSKYFNLKDSLFGIEKMETINSLELKYQKKENEARILGLENDNLKKDSAIREKEFQRNIVSYAALAILLFTILLFAYYRQRSRKNRIIAEQQIKQLEEEKKLLATRSLVEGQEEERKRIAKDLHDGIGVLLSTAKMQFTALKDKSPENSDLVDKAGKLLEQASVDVRRISHNMMPGLLTRFGLDEAIEDLFEQVDDIQGLSAKVNINENAGRIAENQEIMIYRIIQELVNNTLKHAKAKNISLNLNYDGDILKVQYADDGVGFEMKPETGYTSIGMKGIESRISYLNGSINIESEIGNGLLCHISVPVTFR